MLTSKPSHLVIFHPLPWNVASEHTCGYGDSQVCKHADEGNLSDDTVIYASTGLLPAAGV